MGLAQFGGKEPLGTLLVSGCASPFWEKIGGKQPLWARSLGRHVPRFTPLHGVGAFVGQFRQTSRRVPTTTFVGYVQGEFVRV